MFLLLQLSMAVAFASDNMVIAQILGPAAVTQFGVPQRLFGLLLMLISIALSPLWPAYGEALSRTDTKWVKSMLARTLRASLVIVGPMAVVLVLLGQWIIRIWVGPSIDPSWLLLSGFGVWVVISSLGNAMAMFLNGAGKVRFQVMTATAMAVANLVLSIYLTHRIGVPGPIWGSVIAYTVILLVPTFFYVRHVLKRYESTDD
jgi:O-antigen/teichoic acid export membrane protein